MTNKWMDMINCGDFDGLYSEIKRFPKGYIFSNIEMPQTITPSLCDIGFRYYNDQSIDLRVRTSESAESGEIKYNGSDNSIGEWCTSGNKNFRSFDELVNFILSFNSDSIADTDNIGRDNIGHDNSSRGNNSPNNNGCDPTQNIPNMEYESVNVDGYNNDTDCKALYLDRDKLFLDASSEIIGQDEQIKKIVHLISNHLGAKGRKKPLSIFLYGPTGVGKSAVLKVIVEALNKQLERKKRFAYAPFDCSQLQTEYDITKLIGAAPGYVGYGEEGLFDILVENPRAVFVFEEIEKAANNATVAIMQAMDTGRQATNGKRLRNGKNYYDLSDSIIFFTSNILMDKKGPNLGFGVEEYFEQDIHRSSEQNIARKIREDTAQSKKEILEEGVFKKEVIGRMTAIIKFNLLGGKSIVDIAANCISKIARNDYRIYITKLDTPIFKQFLEVAAPDVEDYGVRALNDSVKDYFAEAFLKFSKNNNDYDCAELSGTLDNVVLTKVEHNC